MIIIVIIIISSSSRRRRRRRRRSGSSSIQDTLELDCRIPKAETSQKPQSTFCLSEYSGPVSGVTAGNYLYVNNL